MEKLDWTVVDVGSLPTSAQGLITQVHEAEAAAASVKAEAAKVLSTLAEEAGIVPSAGTQIVWAFRFGSVSFAFAQVKAKKETKKVSLASIKPARKGFRTK